MAKKDKVKEEKPPKEKKPSFFSRLFGRFRKPKQVDDELVIPGSERPSVQKVPSTPRPQQAGKSGEDASLQPGTAAGGAGAAPAQESPRQGKSALLGNLPSQSAPPAAAATLHTVSAGASSSRRVSEASGKTRILVVDDILQTRENVVRALKFQEDFEVVGEATNGVQAIQMVKELQPDVVVMDVNMPDMDGIAATGHIKREEPYVQVIILTVQDDVDYMRKAMLAGARDFLTKPPMIDELMSAVQRASELSRQERKKFITASAPVAVAQQVSYAGLGKIITVYSPRGGAGCSMLASNLAATLYNEDTPVVIVDANLQFGDVPVFFNSQARTTVLDLTPRVAELDRELVEEVAIKHASGVRIIAPPRPEEAEMVHAKDFGSLLEYLRSIYSYVIVDTAHRLSDITLATFDVSDVVVLVTTQDIPAIARTRRFLDLMPLINLDPQRILLVINLYDKRVGITPEKIGETFKREVSAAIPIESEVVVPSVNRGVPFMSRKETFGRPIAQAMLNLVEVVRARIAKLDEAKAALESGS